MITVSINDIQWWQYSISIDEVLLIFNQYYWNDSIDIIDSIDGVMIINALLLLLVNIQWQPMTLLVLLLIDNQATMY